MGVQGDINRVEKEVLGKVFDMSTMKSFLNQHEQAIKDHEKLDKEQDDLTPVTKENLSLEDLKDSWMSKINGNVMFISALHKTCFEELREELYVRIKKLHEVRYPYNNFLY